VIADAPSLTMDAIEKLDQLQRLDEEAGFFAHLAGDAFGDGFTGPQARRPAASNGL